MASFDSIWNIVLGVLSIALAIQTVWRLLKKKLPSKRVRRMYKLLDDADALLISCGEEGLVHGKKAEGFRRNLARLRQFAAEVRLEANTAKSYPEDFANMLKGLTERIDDICQEAVDIRANISTSSMRERERLAAQRRAEDAAHTPSLPDSAEAVVVHTETAPSALEVQVGTIDGLDAQVATPLREAASPLPLPPPVQFSTAADALTALPATTTAPPAARALPERPSMTSLAPVATIRSARQKVRHGDRRCSVSSNSSGSVASSSHSVRWKCKGDPLSRARAKATFLRYTRARGSPGLPVYFVNPQQLAACELADGDSDSSDDDWVDELAVRVVA
ncbi:hypothetical protein C8T65DRAFT_680878 [Cerioporus squamosus]|nr:hypothetical protein C8T65DRAFT_680878 [Cerioporus squamosus]